MLGEYKLSPKDMLDFIGRIAIDGAKILGGIAISYGVTYLPTNSNAEANGQHKGLPVTLVNEGFEGPTADVLASYLGQGRLKDLCRNLDPENIKDFCPQPTAGEKPPKKPTYGTKSVCTNKFSKPGESYAFCGNERIAEGLSALGFSVEAIPGAAYARGHPEKQCRGGNDHKCLKVSAPEECPLPEKKYVCSDKKEDGSDIIVTDPKLCPQLSTKENDGNEPGKKTKKKKGSGGPPPPPPPEGSGNGFNNLVRLYVQPGVGVMNDNPYASILFGIDVKVADKLYLGSRGGFGIPFESSNSKTETLPVNLETDLPGPNMVGSQTTRTTTTKNGVSGEVEATLFYELAKGSLGNGVNGSVGVRTGLGYKTWTKSADQQNVVDVWAQTQQGEKFQTGTPGPVESNSKPIYNTRSHAIMAGVGLEAMLQPTEKPFLLGVSAEINYLGIVAPETDHTYDFRALLKFELPLGGEK